MYCWWILYWLVHVFTMVHNAAATACSNCVCNCELEIDLSILEIDWVSLRSRLRVWLRSSLSFLEFFNFKMYWLIRFWIFVLVVTSTSSKILKVNPKIVLPYFHIRGAGMRAACHIQCTQQLLYYPRTTMHAPCLFELCRSKPKVAEPLPMTCKPYMACVSRQRASLDCCDAQRSCSRAHRDSRPSTTQSAREHSLSGQLRP